MFYRRLALGLVSLAIVAGAEGAARAQASDIDSAKPYAFLLVDTSGSMEYQINVGPDLRPVLPTCDATQNTQPNRWGTLVQTLTGSLLNDGQVGYRCVAVDRARGTTATPSDFVREYSITVDGTTYDPIDTDYYLPYHRPLAGRATDRCFLAPGQLPGTSSGFVGPSTRPSAAQNAGGRAWEWPQNAIVHRRMTDAIGAFDPSLGCFDQLQDGILDATSGIIHYGLMTFDNDTDPFIGTTRQSSDDVPANSPPVPWSGPSVYLPTAQNPGFGSWSYFKLWNVDDAVASVPTWTHASRGKPFECVGDPPFFENGGRNPAAPPWEGRLIPFRSLDESTATDTALFMQQNNDRVQQAILAARPFGATPIHGMIHDAQTFLYEDPRGPQQRDPFIQGGCRELAIILLTDGAPNSDLRPSCVHKSGAGQPCASAAGADQDGGAWQACPSGQFCHENECIPEADDLSCPYRTARDIAADMYAGRMLRKDSQINPTHYVESSGLARVKTYVIGFAVVADGSTTPRKCVDVDVANECRITGTDHDYPAAIRQCCMLHEIAAAGGSGKAYFAENADQLRSQFQAVVNNLQKTVTTRQVPAFASAASSLTLGGSSNRTATAEFLYGFEPQLTGSAFPGKLERKRLVCNDTFTGVTEIPVELQNGDVFNENMRVDNPRMPRRFLVTHTTTGDIHNMRGWVRPGSVSDGVPYSTPETVGPAPTDVFNHIPAAQMGVVGDEDGAQAPLGPPGDCPNRSNQYGLTGLDCTNQFLAHAFALPTFNPASRDSTFPAFHDRSVHPMAGSFANLTVASPFLALTNDRSYLLARCPDPGSSPVACIGGVLGKYRQLAKAVMQDDTRAANPSLVIAPGEDGLVRGFLSSIDKQENNAVYELMPPYVVPGLKAAYNNRTPLLSSTPAVAEVALSRTATELKSPGTSYTQWRTVLVSAFGEGSGYFAYDITDPRVPDALSSTQGPQFLWQAASDPSDSFRYFGLHTYPPAIGVVQVQENGDAEPRQVAVAFLPGGVDGPPAGYPSYPSPPYQWECTRRFLADTANDNNALYESGTGSNTVPKWGPSCDGYIPGRALYVVEIATGKILRMFTPTANLPSTDLAALQAHVESGRVIDTPLDAPMTVAAAYPTGVGAITRQVYVGTASGDLWRFNVSDLNPSNWRGYLYADTYHDAAMSQLANQNSQRTPSSIQATLPDAAHNYRVREPILMPPTISVGRSDRLVLHVATGSPDNFLDKGLTFLYAIEERNDRGKIDWYQPLIWERVTGPMALFDNVLYYTTFTAPVGSASCSSGGARLYARDYELPYQPNGNASERWFGGDRVTSISSALFPWRDEGQNVVPGVALRAKQACIDQFQVTDGNGTMNWQVNNVTRGQYELYFTVGKKSSTGTQTLETRSVGLANPSRRSDFAWFGVVNGDLL